jgi:hypothetical protein
VAEMRHAARVSEGGGWANGRISKPTRMLGAHAPRLGGRGPPTAHACARPSAPRLARSGRASGHALEGARPPR